MSSHPRVELNVGLRRAPRWGRGHSTLGAGLREPPGPALGSLPELLILAPPCLPQYEIK